MPSAILAPHPKPCPICLVAMQSSKTGQGLTFRCEGCEMTIVYGNPAEPADREAVAGAWTSAAAKASQLRRAR